MRPGSSQPHRARAETIGFAHDLYDVDSTPPPASTARFVDALWDEYEPWLTTALDMLTDDRFDLDHGINVLVPFVGSLLVRDRWYGTRLADAHRRDNPEHWFAGRDAFVVSNARRDVTRIA